MIGRGAHFLLLAVRAVSKDCGHSRAVCSKYIGFGRVSDEQGVAGVQSGSFECELEYFLVFTQHIRHQG